jgi:peroxiredoxin
MKAFALTRSRRRALPALGALWLGSLLLALTAPPLAAQTKQPLQLDAPKAPVKALDFTGISSEGKPVRLSDHRGQVVLLNFWATWCIPCLEEMPALDRLNQRLQGKPFRILAVDLQEPAEKVQQFAKAKGYSFDLVLDPAGEISHHYGVLRIPVTYVIDPRGFVIRRAQGPRVWDSAESVAFFQDLMQKAATPIKATPAADTSRPPLTRKLLQ